MTGTECQLSQFPLRCQFFDPLLKGLLLHRPQDRIDKPFYPLGHESNGRIHSSVILDPGVQELVDTHAQCVENDGIKLAHGTTGAAADDLV